MVWLSIAQTACTWAKASASRSTRSGTRTIPIRSTGWTKNSRPFPQLKIIRIIARLNVGGPARHVVWLTRSLQDDEFESRLVAGRVPPGEEDMAYVARANKVEPVFIEQMSREL